MKKNKGIYITSGSARSIYTYGNDDTKIRKVLTNSSSGGWAQHKEEIKILKKARKEKNKFFPKLYRINSKNLDLIIEKVTCLSDYDKPASKFTEYAGCEFDEFYTIYQKIVCNSAKTIHRPIWNRLTQDIKDFIKTLYENKIAYGDVSRRHVGFNKNGNIVFVDCGLTKNTLKYYNFTKVKPLFRKKWNTILKEIEENE